MSDDDSTHESKVQADSNALASGEISIGRDVNRSVVIIGSDAVRKYRSSQEDHQVKNRHANLLDENNTL